MLAAEVKEGVTTFYLDKLAESFIRDHGANLLSGLIWFPKFALYESKCTSSSWILNNTPLSGDIISIDCGAYKTAHGDHAYTFGGEVAPN
jgi:methionyl aminopeptidase